MARIVSPLPLVFIAFTCVSGVSSVAQEAAPGAQSATSSATTTGNPTPVPTPTGVLGTLDPAALTEVNTHRAVVGGGSWAGMQAVGQITYGAETTSYPVTLSNFGDRAFRLDVTTSKGIASTRIYGVVGKQQESDGATTPIAIETSQSGLFPFQLARSVYLQSPSISLTDGGMITVDGIALHRVTLERATMGRNPATKQRRTVVIDLYFDPSTHLLVRSRVPVDIGHNVKLVSDVTYSDYRLVGIARIPFHFNETIDGQQYRSLQLSVITIVPTLDSTLFAF